MTNQNDGSGIGISDEELPEDLQPTDDNPLAKPLSEEDDPQPREELDMSGGKTPEQSGDPGDPDGETHDTDDSGD